MKQFIYFEDTEGGMDEFFVHSERDLYRLYGWMAPDCKARDTTLVNWMGTAEVGDFYGHRLGCLVRLKDI